MREELKENRLFDLIYEKYEELKKALKIIDDMAVKNSEKRGEIVKSLMEDELTDTEELIFEISVDNSLYSSEVLQMYNSFIAHYQAFNTLESGLLFESELIDFIKENNHLEISRKFDVENSRFKELEEGTIETVRNHYRGNIITKEYARHLAKQLQNG